MLNLKKTAIAVAAVVACGAAQAGGYTPPACTGVNVTVPCEEQAWDVGIQALYVQPISGSNQYWAPEFNNNLTDWRWLDSDPKWTWGFRLEGSYHFGTGNDINVNWTHFSKKTDRNKVYDLAILAPGLTFNFDFWNDNKFDAVNVEFGQHVDFGENKNIRFHGGVQYARVDYTNHWAGSVPQIPGNDVVNVQDASKFNGFGPRAGVDMSYDFGNGFSILGSTAGSILVGTLKSTFTVGTVGQNIGQLLPQDFNLRASKTAIVPSVEAKLGAKYTHAMAQGDLSIEGGWMFANYWDSVQTTVLLPDNHSFGYQGPYLGLKWVGNA